MGFLRHDFGSMSLWRLLLLNNFGTSNVFHFGKINDTFVLGTFFESIRSRHNVFYYVFLGHGLGLNVIKLYDWTYWGLLVSKFLKVSSQTFLRFIDKTIYWK